MVEVHRRHGLRAIALLVLAIASVGCSSKEKPDVDALRALRVVRALEAGDFATVHAKFDSQMSAALPPDKLTEAWRAFEGQFGAFEAAGKPTMTKLGGLTVEQVPVRMSRGRGEVRVTFNPDGTIAGLYFLKPDVPVNR